MARKITARQSTLAVFDGKFLAGFSATATEIPPYGVTQPSAKDAAVALAIVSLFTAIPYANTDPAEKLATLGGLKDGAWTGVHVSTSLLMAVGGFDRTRLLEQSLSRISRSQINGRPFVDGADGFDASGSEIRVGLNGAVLARAHPFIGDSTPISVDLRVVGSFGCRHTAPVYLRALAWMKGVKPRATHECAVTLTSTGVVAEIAADAVTASLGLDMDRWLPSESKRLFSSIQADFDRTKLGVSFRWKTSLHSRNARLRIEIAPLKEPAMVAAAALLPKPRRIMPMTFDDCFPGVVEESLPEPAAPISAVVESAPVAAPVQAPEPAPVAAAPVETPPAPDIPYIDPEIDPVTGYAMSRAYFDAHRHELKDMLDPEEDEESDF